ncbi:MAG: hypothetical protein AABW50_01625 [Nanoarchaeota archaeon]
MVKSFQDKCRRLAVNIIKKSFPELKNKRILVFTVPFRKAYSGMIFWLFWPLPQLIFINKKRNKESIQYLNGLLCHEICHLVLIERRGFAKSVFRGIFYFIIPKLRRLIEDEVNRFAIQKGYSKEIHFFTKKVEKKKTSAGIQRFYMNSEDIKNYAKSVGKW